MAIALRGRTTAVNIKLEMVMKMISTVVEFLQNPSEGSTKNFFGNF